MKIILADDFRSVHRALTVEERGRLEELMRLSPETVPPCVVSKFGNGPATLVAGYHRYAASIKLGISAKFVEKDFPDRDTALAFAAAVQFAGRQSTPAERAESLKKFPTDVLRRMANGEADPPKRRRQVTSTDGGSKRDRINALSEAAKCSQATARRAINEDKEDEAGPEEPAPPATDDEGQPVPKHLLDIFKQAEEFEQAAREITKIQKWAKEISPLECATWLHLQSLIADLDNAKQALRFNKPYAVCPYCQARKKSCEACKGHGFVSKGIYKAAPQEMRA